MYSLKEHVMLEFPYIQLSSCLAMIFDGSLVACGLSRLICYWLAWFENKEGSLEVGSTSYQLMNSMQ